MASPIAAGMGRARSRRAVPASVREIRTARSSSGRRSQQSVCLQALEQRGQRAVVEVERGAEFLDGDLVPVPEHQQYEVLGVGEPEFLQYRPVEPGDGAGGGVEGEAHLVVEEQGEPRLGLVVGIMTAHRTRIAPGVGDVHVPL